MSRKPDTPFKRFSRYNTWKHFVDLKELEVKISLLLTPIVIGLMYFLNCFDKIELFREGFQSITIYIAAAFIGVLGFILTGIAMITAMLNNEVCKKIEAICGEDSLRKILCSFEFIAFVVSVLIVVLFTVYLSFFSDLSLFDSLSFYILSAILIYLVIFVIFYLFSLIGNCIQIFYITNMYQEINNKEEKQFNELLNEIRIDFILTKMAKNNTITSETFIDDLINFIDNHQIKDREKIIQYFKEHYGIDK